jgi:hypothetical protein
MEELLFAVESLGLKLSEISDKLSDVIERLEGVETAIESLGGGYTLKDLHDEVSLVEMGVSNVSSGIDNLSRK